VVAAVGTSDEALEHAGQADLVLMDIRIDGPRDGVETAAAIREKFHIPVIFLTAHADKATLERAKQTGPFAYMVKPLAPATLNASIEVALYKHRMERELKEREAWQRTILESVADAVIVTGTQGLVRLLNPAAEALTGWTQAEAAGQPVAKVVRLVDGDLGEAAEDPLALAMLRDAPAALDRSVRLVSRTGREMPVEGLAAPVKAPRGASGAARTLGAVVTLRDVGLRRWEERQLDQSRKMEALGRLAAGVANDYTNLLAIIRMQAEHLLRQFGEYSAARQAAEEIHQAAAAAGRITDRLAAFGTRQVRQPEVLSLNGLLRRVAKMIEATAGERIAVALRPDRACGQIRADAAQIEQAILNLAVHACGQMPEGGQLCIETGNLSLPVGDHANAFALLAVTHNGVEAEPEKLFEPSSTGPEALALSLVHGIVSEHGGYVSAHATAQGGCRFEILLPNWSEPATPSRLAGVPARSILLVDSRERIRAELHNFFEAQGFNLLEAGDAEEAVALGQVHEGSLDLLVADAAQADKILGELSGAHPHLEALRIVDSAVAGPRQIRRPFTRLELLERAGALLGAPERSLAADALAHADVDADEKRSWATSS
jgi:PAS domain S-box-containing protein